MAESKIIFVGGIHGVGKGTFCKKLTENFDLTHLTASEVLKWNEISDLKNKKVSNIHSTQERLINNLNQIIKSDQNYLLDGHFTLLNSDGEPEKIPDSTFEGIMPISIFLLTCEPTTVLSRLNKRDNSSYDLNVVQKMQDMEIQHANHISTKLGIPLFEIKNNNVQSVYSYLDSL
nr:ATP-binding protein [Allomuricauda sp.]